MKAEACCTPGAVTIAPDESLVSAARLMREKHVGFLAVVDPARTSGPGAVCGVLTDRDIVVAVVAEQADPSLLAVRDVMTRNPLIVHQSHAVESVLALMRENGVRRVPVVDDDGRVTGVLALDDILDTVAEQLGSVAETTRNERQLEQLHRT